MIGAKATAAAFGEEVGWHAIDWTKANRVVRRLQARIVKAVQEGDWRRVKRLQRFLTNSFSGRACAVRRVYREQREECAGRRWRNMEPPGGENQSGLVAQEAGISTPSTEADLHTESKR